MLIDDDEDEYLIFSDAIRELSVKVQCIYAQTAELSFEMLRSACPLMIFVDMNMPAVNGIECIKRLKDIHGQNAPPIVLYSTHVNPRMVESAKSAGANDCLKKTSSIDDLVEKLRSFFDALEIPL